MQQSIDRKTLSRRDFIRVASKYGLNTATLVAFAGVPFGLSVTEVAAQTAGEESDRKATAKHTMILSIDGTLDRYPDGPVTTETLYTMGSAKFKHDVQEMSGGRIYVDIKPGGVLGFQPGSKIQQGVIQAGTMTTQNCTSLVPLWNVLDFPFTVGTPENMKKIFYSKEINDTLRKQSEEQGLINIGGDITMRWLQFGQSVNKDIVLPDDVAGLKIRATNSRMELAGLNALGANPTPISAGEIVTAMEQGVIDGFNIAPHFLPDAGLTEAVRQMVDVQFMPNTDCIFVNARWMRGLPVDDQDAIMQASFERQKYLIETFEPVYNDQLGVAGDSPADTPIKRAGITVRNLDQETRNAWKEKMSFEKNPELAELADRFGRRELELVREVAEQGDPAPRPWWE